MKADENIGVHPFGNGDAVLQRNITIVRAREIDVPAVTRKQRLQTPRPIEREIFFELFADDALGAALITTVAGINHDGSSVQSCASRLEERNKAFGNVEAVDAISFALICGANPRRKLSPFHFAN